MKKLLFLTSVVATLLSACGGGDSGSVAVNPQPANVTNTAVQINLGDSPADRLLAVGMTVTAMRFTQANGTSVSVLTEPHPVEMMRLMGAVTPLALASLPQGNYTGVTMSFGESTVTYLDSVTGQVAQRTVPGPMTANLTFGQPLNVGATPTVVNLDMDMGASVFIDAGGNVVMTPTLSARSNAIVAGSRDTEDGGMHGLTAMVGGVQGSGFTLSMPLGLNGASISTHADTHFSGLTGMGMMAGNMLVSVDALPQADGTWLATRVQSRMGAGGAMAAGVVTAISGDPPTQLTLVMHYGVGNGVSNADIAGLTTVNLDSATQFSIDADDVDLTGLPFTPQFDRAHLSKGQAVEAWSGSQIGHDMGQDHGMGGMGGMRGGGTVGASSVQLEQQGMRGTVSGYASTGSKASFTLTLPADSAFATLTGRTTVTVHQQANTQLRGLSSVTNGSTVVVRGLLFVDGGALRLVAGRIVSV